MMRSLLAVALLVPFVGCAVKLNDKRSFELEPGLTQELTIDAVAKAQKITIDFTATGAPISLYAIKESDKATATKEIDQGKKPAAALATMEKATKGPLVVQVPANTAMTVIITGTGKKTKVDVHMHN